jgi:hypothetical protein
VVVIEAADAARAKDSMRTTIDVMMKKIEELSSIRERREERAN